METIAKTIYQQLGGNRFAFMVGAKYFAYGDTSLQFRVMRNSNRINCVKITLNGVDLYDLEFYWCDKNGCTIKSSFTDVYGDQLQKFFTIATGLYTSL
jgi:hypothetical protein